MTEWTTKGKSPTKADELRSLIQDAQRKGFNWRPANADVLAALDAAGAQGYARAMGEVVAYADSAAMGCAPLWDPRVAGRQDGFDRVADWARERLPAASGRALGDCLEPALAPPPVPQIQHPPASADSQQQGDDGEDGLGEV